METENPQTNQPQTENPQTETDKPDLAERVGIVEAILFVTGNAVEKSEICRAMGINHEELEETLNALRAAMITTAGGCACCDSASTFSWRRGRITPNMWKSCFNRCRSSRFHRR